mmetsp:Transcript_24668/g.72153  ORF Transcript_24668/g.72153 Transcript_24668/m.72153 type:complete len:491 (-) Transcript_24668:66-1538(-)
MMVGVLAPRRRPLGSTATLLLAAITILSLQPQSWISSADPSPGAIGAPFSRSDSAWRRRQRREERCRNANSGGRTKADGHDCAVRRPRSNAAAAVATEGILATKASIVSARLVPRGGASPPTSRRVGSGDGTLGPDAVVASSNLLAPMWRSAASLARESVGPALRDPRGRIVEPMGRFLGERAAEARERRRDAGGRNEGAGGTTTTALAGAAFGMGRAAKMTLAAFLVAEALGRAGVFSDEDEDEKFCRDDPTATSQRQSTPFDEFDVGAGIQRGRGSFRGARDCMGDWWEQARSPGGILYGGTWGDRFVMNRAFRHDVVRPLSEAYASLRDRHKFAIGAAAGLTYSPSLFALGGRVIAAAKWAAAVYVLAEVANAMGRGRTRRGPRSARVSDIIDTSKLRKFAREFELDDQMDDAIRAANRGLRGVAGKAARDGFDILEDLLDDVRKHVRRAARRPGQAVDEALIFLDDNREAMSGMVLGGMLAHFLAV